MTTPAIPLVAQWGSVLVGVFLLALGGLLLVNPELGERVFGVQLNEGGQYAFHLATGAREAYLGLLIVLLVVVRAYQALGVLFLSVVTVPVTDFLITMSAPGNSVAMAALKHLSSVPLVLSLGIYFLRVSRTG